MTPPPSSAVDLAFRPATYWPLSPTVEQLLSRIRGRARQDLARRTFEEQGFQGLTTFLAREELSPQDRAAWGALHPSLMGGEYLPRTAQDEVEIVRVSLASVTSDQISIRARRVTRGIRYRVVGEYDYDPGMRYQLPFNRSAHPLTLGKLVQLIDGSRIPDDIYEGGLVVANWESELECRGRGPEAAIQFVDIDSPFYRDLGAYYAAVAEEWCAEKRSNDEDPDDA